MPDYKRVYVDFIADRRLREGELIEFDRHHILPRCLRGSNEPENLIRLSYSDHLFAHVLLSKIHGGLLAVSANRMSGMSKYRGRRSRERYAHLRAAHRLAISGPNLKLRGRQLSEEHKAKLRGPRPDMLGNTRANQSKSPEHRARIGAAHVGMKRSEQARANMREAQSRRRERENAQRD